MTASAQVDEAQRAGPAVARPAGSGPLYTSVTALAVFLGAFLLFQVQPLIANAVLPWFGGTAAVWTTALLFFQAALVAGYGFVDLTHRLVPPRQRIVFQLLLTTAALLLLPILPAAHQKPVAVDDPTLPILLLLASCVGLPYFVLATTSPLLQDWYRLRFPDRSPYRLYALSNFGSLCGLLTYPLVIEPAFDLPRQSYLWSGLFGVYAAALAFCALASWRLAPAVADVPALASNPAPPAAESSATKSAKKKSSPHAKPSAVPASSEITWRHVAAWLALSFGGTLLLLTTTNYLSLDVAPDPLLWVLPLALYLLTFIVAFDRPGWYKPGLTAGAVLIAVPAAAAPVTISIWPVLAANLVMLFAGCLMFHGELARRKPDARFLTRFYVWVAFGGALAGVFVALLAPRIYNRSWELFGALVGSWLFAAAILAAALTKARILTRGPIKIGYISLLVAGFAGLIRILFEHLPENELLSVRNVYGTLYIQGLYDRQSKTLVGFSMRSGSTQHGSQVFASNNAHIPTSYYSFESGVGTALWGARKLDPKTPRRVGVVGLGAGTIAAYARQGDYYRFYEINPLVFALAKEHFTYLGDCLGKCDVVLGDARMSLEAEDAQDFDMLVLDAFSSDAIPKHLLTREAFQTYLRHLDDQGIIAVHISNRYLNLEPLMSALAAEFGLQGVLIHTDEELSAGNNAARWILLTRAPAGAWFNSLKHPKMFPLPADAAAPLWTDAHSSILPLLK